MHVVLCPVISCWQTKKAELEESRQQLTEAQTALTELQASFEQVGKGVLRQTHACAFRRIPLRSSVSTLSMSPRVPSCNSVMSQAAVAHRRTRCP